MIEKKTELLSFVTITLVVAGILKTYLFYKLFNINILPFLELDEVLINCFDALLFYALLAGFSTTVIYVFCRGLLRSENSFHQMKVRERYRAYQLFSKWKFVFLLLSIGCALIFNYKLRITPNTTDLWYWIGAMVLSIYLIPVAFCEFDRTLRTQTTNSIPTASVFFSCFLLLTCTVLIAYNDAYKVKDKQYYLGSYVEINSGGDNYKKILSTETYYFIGMTKSHLFFYDSKRESTDVIPRDQVHFLSIK